MGTKFLIAACFFVLCTIKLLQSLCYEDGQVVYKTTETIPEAKILIQYLTYAAMLYVCGLVVLTTTIIVLAAFSDSDAPCPHASPSSTDFWEEILGELTQYYAYPVLCLHEFLVGRAERIDPLSLISSDSYY